MNRPLVLAFSVALFCGAPLAGAQGDPSARATLDLDVTEMTVGDRVTAMLVVEHRADETVVWPDSLDLEPFEVLAFSPGPPRVDGDRAVSEASIALTVFELGELEVPPIELLLADAGGAERRVLSDPFAVGVVSVGLDEGADIRDVKGPRSIARNWLLLWPWLLLAAALGGLAYREIRRRDRRGRTSDPVAVVALRSPHQAAHEALDRLERSNLLERGQVKAFHIEVSQILRAYVEERFDLDALEMTTREVIDGLREKGLDAAVLDDGRRFLVACDLVKFAKRRPSDAESLELIPVARGIVDATVPVRVDDPVDAADEGVKATDEGVKVADRTIDAADETEAA